MEIWGAGVEQRPLTPITHTPSLRAGSSCWREPAAAPAAATHRLPDPWVLLPLLRPLRLAGGPCLALWQRAQLRQGTRAPDARDNVN